MTSFFYIKFHYINYTSGLKKLVFVILFYGSNSFAQPLQFSHLGVDEGLSQSSVYSMFQDSRGFLWFGTGDGLNRYDGVQIKIYRNSKQNSSLNNFIGEKIIEDHHGDLWIGSRNGLNKYDYRKDKFIPYYPGSDSSKFHRWIDILGFDANKKLWLWDRNSLLFQFNIEDNSFKIIPLGDKENVFRHGFLDKEGQIWYNTKNGISSYNTVLQSFTTHLENYFNKSNPGGIYKIAGDKEGLIWLCGAHKVICYDPKSQQTVVTGIKNLSQESKWSSVAFHKERVWLGSSKGLFCYDKITGITKEYQHNNSDPSSLRTDFVNTIYIDQSENLWVATEGYGLNRVDIKPEKFPFYKQNHESGWDFSSNFIKCFYEDPKGRLWIGTNEEGINIFDRSNNKVTVYKNKSATKNTIRCFGKDNTGQLLIGTDYGIKYSDTTGKKFKDIPCIGYRPGLDKLIILGFCNTQQGQVLAASSKGLLEAIYLDGRIDHFSTVKNTAQLFLGAVFQSFDGKIWLSSGEGGDYYFYDFKNGELLAGDKILTGCYIRSFYEDKNTKELWMGSDKGLIRYEQATKRYTFFDESYGLGNNHIYGLLCDMEDRLWMSTNKGISSFDRSTEKFRNFDASDGLQSNEFNTGAYYKSNSGELFFGGINGFNAFFPSRIKFNPYKPKVSLIRLLLNDDELSYDGNIACIESLRLEYSENTFSLDFIALEFTKPEKNQYQYKLVGNDKDWVDAGNKHFARYSNLGPGNYTFYVKASNNDGLWSDEIKICRIVILPPWYLTWWALIAYLLLISAIIWILFRSYVKRKMRVQQRIIEKQKAVEEERKRISNDMHDDLGSGLTKIAIMSQLLKSEGNQKND